MSKIDYAAIGAAGGLGKGPTRKQIKSGRRQVHRDVVSEVRAAVFVADRVCVVCLGQPGPTDAMHEVLSRAQTRGLPPEERFHLRNCVRVHDGPGYDCHRKITGDLGGNKTLMTFLNGSLGVDGGLIIYKHDDIDADGMVSAVVYRRGPSPVHEPVRWDTTVTPGDAGVGGDDRQSEDEMVSMPVRTVMAAAFVPRQEERTVGATKPEEVGADTVQKPVTQPKKTRTPRTGPRPVTKGVTTTDASTPAEPAAPKVKVKKKFVYKPRPMVVLFSKSSRTLVSKALRELMSKPDPANPEVGVLTDTERAQAQEIVDRITAKDA